MVYLDGELVKKDMTDIWQNGKSTKLDITVTLNKGNHVLEYFGTEKCCDGTTKWTFQVNGGEWEDFTVPNLDKYAVPMTQPPAENTTNIVIKTFRFKQSPVEKLSLFTQRA